MRLSRKAPGAWHRPCTVVERAEHPTSMRLLPRLVIAQGLPVALLVLVLAGTLVSLARVNALLTQLRETELGEIYLEERLHRAAWGVEVASRRADEICAQAPSSRAVDTGLGEVKRALESALLAGDGVGGAIPSTSRRYLALAGRLLESPTCAIYQSPDVIRERRALDTELTDAWVARLFELHAAVTKREEEARGLATRTLLASTVVGLLALGWAGLLARRTARSISEPLGELASTARRIGEGDFTKRDLIVGPEEVTQLSREIDHMRTRLAELDALKQSFLASVSHELRTPLAKIREVFTLLGDGVTGPLTDRQTRVVGIGREACELEIRLVSTLLDLSRLRSGSPLRKAPGSFDEAIEAALGSERSEAEARGVTLTLEREGEPRARGELDRALVERAIANLVRNAIAVSPRGGRVEVRRSLVSRAPELEPSEAHQFVRIAVLDQGPGVPHDARAHLFEPFFTRPVEGTAKGLGIGLGLALTREVARSHGGSVELAPTSAGLGACFALYLPLAPTQGASLERGAPERVARDAQAKPERSASKSSPFETKQLEPTEAGSPAPTTHEGRGLDP